MGGIFQLLKKNKKEHVPQIKIEKSRTSEGLKFLLYKEDTKELPLSFPLQLSILEIKQQNNIELLEVLEALWYEEFLEEHSECFTLPYFRFKELPSEIKNSLGIPEETSFELRLSNSGAIGSSNFKYVLEKDHKDWKNIQNTAGNIGPWITLVDGTILLMDHDQYEFEELLKQTPDPKDREALFSFVAKVRKETKKRDISLNNYLEKQDFLFIDEYEIDVQKDMEEIVLIPDYKLSDSEDDTSVLNEMSANSATYYSDKKGKKFFVNPGIQNEMNVIKQIPPIKGSQIPRFVENPELFLPEFENLNLSNFSERVRSLGIQVYRAQPFVHATEKERGWFDLEVGFSAIDETGESQHSFAGTEIEDLVNYAKVNGDEFIPWNGNWLKIPDEAEQFLSATHQLKNEVGINNPIDVSKLPYILEIYDNINQLEFNQPLLEVQKMIDDLGVANSNTSDLFTAELKPFQTDGFIWMKLLHFRRLGGLLADDMGLGKTIQVLSFLIYLYETGQLSPTLIVAPKTLIDNWQKEMKKFAPILLSSVYVHQGSQRNKNPEMIQRHGVTLTTYQTLVKDQLILGQIDWKAIICDEAQAIKNPSTSASRVTKAMKSRFRLALTGTPVENSLSDLWSIMDFVQPGILGSLNQFKSEFINKIDKDADSEIEEKLISRIAKVYKRRTKSEELNGQLPPKQSFTKEVGFGQVQQKLYGEVIALVQNKMMDGLEAIQKLKALSSHPGLINKEYLDLPVEQVPKLHETLNIIEIISKKNEKVLIFTEYINMQNILRKKIRERFNINPNIINGMTDRRQETVDIFNTKEGFDVLILSPKAAGTGLTITSANHVIHYTRWWNPAVENQATDRAYRIGQEKPVYVYYPIVTDPQGALARGTVEEIVHKILSDKQELASNVITASKKMNIEEEVFNLFVN
ncbi:DEAD/DEAH box helicase [Fictibacillus sp. B-59209]|uniref:DEAD/DEAH box helicase n=1 Tax=Fictibacillus sp. B-59209 TaxID=3024873 RepID=UPI002E250FB0|nr:DEAD/DEAH box helicase [Fictibacillus sp. B-59209]